MTPAARHDTVIDEQIRRLADCDESLSQIAANMTGLLDELSSLRQDADELHLRLTEREALLAEKTLELSTLEAERTEACRRADEAATTLADAERALHDEHGRAEPLVREVESLRDDVAGRDHRLGELEAELSRVREALAAAEADRRPDAPFTPAESETAVRPVLQLVATDVARPEPEASTPSLDPPAPRPDVTARHAGHVLFAASPEGYRLVVSDEPCSRPGDLVDLDGRRFVVTRVGPSPLPADDRPCAFLAADLG